MSCVANVEGVVTVEIIGMAVPASDVLPTVWSEESTIVALPAVVGIAVIAHTFAGEAAQPISTCDVTPAPLIAEHSNTIIVGMKCVNPLDGNV